MKAFEEDPIPVGFRYADLQSAVFQGDVEGWSPGVGVLKSLNGKKSQMID